MSASDPASVRELLPHAESLDVSAFSGLSIARRDRVFVNRNLRLGDIDWFGFDMDYTMALYNQEAMDTLSVEMTVARMVSKGYPEWLESVSYDYRFPIRGLLVDKQYGNVLKMDRFAVVQKGYHGVQQLPWRTLQELYSRDKIRLSSARFNWIDTLFSLCEVTSYAAIIEGLEQHAEAIDYAQVFEDVRATIDEAHRDGEVHRMISAAPERYLERDPELARTLHKLRSGGKKLFLLTNSPFAYTNAVMTYILGDAMAEYPSWRHYFDVVIVSARKPLWFTERNPLFEREGDNLRAFEGPLERGRVYEGGHLLDFEERMQTRGRGVLYVGDHIFGDILRSKKESTWRTAMIIQELDAELEAHGACTTKMAEQRQLEELRAHAEDELRFYQARYRALGKSQSELEQAVVGAQRARFKRALDSVRRELKQINRAHAQLQQEIDGAFHPYWGSLLKEHREMSSFGLQVETYADIYMRSVSCLRHYSPKQVFRSPHDLMPHEL